MARNSPNRTFYTLNTPKRSPIFIIYSVSPCVHLQFGPMMAQKDRAGEYIIIKYDIFALEVTIATGKETMTVTVSVVDCGLTYDYAL